MIPRRVFLRGFLCYREEQEIDFGGATLWMLAGLNGSGKSAVFDAVTYALFGHHRGGATGATELINKESDGLAVEFDFLLDGDLYRVKRTLKKSAKGNTAATQQILRHRPPADGPRSGRWDPVPDTGRKAEFDAWVRDRVGLTYETFTSSVLLLQGKAERLLDSTAKGRFEVLAGIVDLERYARLHQRADERRKALKGQVETLESQLKAAPEVDPQEFVAIGEQIGVATADRDRARADVERWQAVEFQARRWAELQAKRAHLDREWTQAQALITEANAIERDLDRLRDLHAALPHLESIIKLRADLAESEKKTAALTESRQSYHDRLAAAAHALDQAQKKRALLHKSIAQDERKQQTLAERLRTLSGLLAKVELYESQDREARRLADDRAKLPADLDAELDRARQAHDDLAVLAGAVPGLSRLHQARADLVAARAREADAVGAELAVRAAGEQLATELSALGPRVQGASDVRQRADEEATAARTLLAHTRDQLKAFRELQGAKVCRACGQPLTAAHFENEVAKREEEVQAAEARVAKTTAAQREAQQEEQSLRARHDALERQRQAKREEYRDVQRRLTSAREDIARLTRDCTREYGELPEPFRGRVSPAPPADWAATTYPTADELAAVRRQADGLPVAHKQLMLVQQQAARAASLSDQLARVRRHLDELSAGIAEEPATVRRQYAGCEADERAVAIQLQAQRDELHRNQEEIDRLAREREKCTGQIADFDGQLQTEEAKRTQWRRSQDGALAALPCGWQVHAGRAKLSELHAWKAERDDLLARQTEQRAHALRQATKDLDALRQRRVDLDREAAAIPAEACRPPEELHESVRSAKESAAACDDRLAAAQQQKVMLEARRAQRARLDEQYRAADREHRLQELLAKLLGRDRLQLYLVRRAERQIVDHANAVLDRLSGGQLALRLRGGDDGDEADKALELEAYNRVTGGAPINVAFLSGSQRFRVAVALALGIGQYASRQHRPIESVIIDEGFGCLDRYGRQVMIQELQNLRGHLHCILLVSHQEEFAEAFSDGYRFELEDGTTRVTRMQR
jgi:DNA repair protein SbcC/Rad50